MSQRILLVDDQPQNLRLLEAILAPYGYSISSASSGDEAMRSMATESPDLVLLDVVMPGMTGYDVCLQIRANDATLPEIRVFTPRIPGHGIATISVTCSANKCRRRVLPGTDGSTLVRIRASSLREG